MKDDSTTETIIIAHLKEPNFSRILDVINTKIRGRPTTIVAGSDITLSKIVNSLNFFTKVDNIDFLCSDIFDEENDGIDFVGAIGEINQYLDLQKVLVILAPKKYATWLALYLYILHDRAKSLSFSSLDYGVWTIKIFQKPKNNFTGRPY